MGMDWLERLNRVVGKIILGQGTVEVLQWAYARHLADNMPHRHTFFEVCLVGKSGQGQFIVQDKIHPLKPGDLFIARPGVVHQIVNTQRPPMELYWFSFQWTPATNTPLADGDRLLRGFAESSVLAVPDETKEIASIWAALRTVAGGSLRSGQELQYQALASALLVGVADLGTGERSPMAVAPAESGLENMAARLAVRFIHDNLSQALSPAEIAAQVHVSPRHLSRVFSVFTGVSPAHYIRQARLDRAKNLLRSSPLAIKAIAAEVGYPDVHHFTRLFTRQFGCPPAAFRRSKAGYVPNIQKRGDLV